MITGIGHVAYTVRDMDATLRFYCEQLGFAHAFSIADEHGNPWVEYVKVAPGQFLEFFYAKAAALGETPVSYRHLCLCVDDLRAQVETLQVAGVRFRLPPRQGKDGNWQAWAVDPDGNQIEFMQIMPDSPQGRA